MKLLRLTTSIDLRGSVPVELRAPALVDADLAATIGEPMETAMYPIWPKDRMDAVIGRWARQAKPDIALIVITPYWFAYESVPLKAGRAGGGLLRAPMRRLQRWGAHPRVVRSRLLWSVRNLALRSGGGSAFFEPEQVVEAVKSYLDVLAIDPGIVPAVYGLPRSDLAWGKPRRPGWARERRLTVYRAITEYCAERGIPHETSDVEVPDDEWLRYREADGVHINAAGHQRLADHQLPLLLRAWDLVKERRPRD